MATPSAQNASKLEQLAVRVAEEMTPAFDKLQKTIETGMTGNETNLHAIFERLALCEMNAAIANQNTTKVMEAMVAFKASADKRDTAADKRDAAEDKKDAAKEKKDGAHPIELVDVEREEAADRGPEDYKTPELVVQILTLLKEFGFRWEQAQANSDILEGVSNHLDDADDADRFRIRSAINTIQLLMHRAQ